MNLKELAYNIDTMVTYDKATSALFKYLKKNKEILLEMNKEQLFEDSIGTDNKPLGFYSNSLWNQQYDKAGQPYTMVDSGLFKAGMRIDFYYKHITIQSIYHTWEMQKSGNFLTLNWFGLTEDNYERLKEEYTIKFMREWLLQTMLDLPVT